MFKIGDKVILKDYRNAQIHRATWIGSIVLRIPRGVDYQHILDAADIPKHAVSALHLNIAKRWDRWLVKMEIDNNGNPMQYDAYQIVKTNEISKVEEKVNNEES